MLNQADIRRVLGEQDREILEHFGRAVVAQFFFLEFPHQQFLQVRSLGRRRVSARRVELGKDRFARGAWD